MEFPQSCAPSDDLIHRDALTVNGKTMGENTANAPCWNAEVIHTRQNPIREHGGIAVLRGNLAPGGALIKPSAATPSLIQHRGRAVVFKDIEISKSGSTIPRWRSTRTR